MAHADVKNCAIFVICNDIFLMAVFVFAGVIFDPND